jgi:hypothetical protein
MIDSSIDEAIDQIREYFVDRSATLEQERDAYAAAREKRMDEIRDEIGSYRQQMDEETGPEIKALQDQLESLEAEKKVIEASEGEDKKSQLQAVENKISEKSRELEAALSDPWTKRLQRRIVEKEKAIAGLSEAIEAKKEETAETIDGVRESVQNDTDEFNSVRELLKRELKKAKLKRELDLLKANKDRKKEKAAADYEHKENRIYQDLLTVKYGHEEKIIDSRIDALDQDYESRGYDLETGYQKERERLEDEFSFQERFLMNKIAELEKKAKAEGGESAASERDAMNEELAAKRDSHAAALKELEKKLQALLAEEELKYENGIADLEWQMQMTRLVYLQTDNPYLNTTVHASLTNFGSKIKFVEEGYPLPTTAHIGVGYAVLNSGKHTVKLGMQLDIPFHDEIALNMGAEYGFHNIAYVRVGYSFLTPYQSFSTGIGARVPMGFTEYAVDYTFQPIPDYGFVHSFGVSAYF